MRKNELRVRRAPLGGIVLAGMGLGLCIAACSTEPSPPAVLGATSGNDASLSSSGGGSGGTGSSSGASSGGSDSGVPTVSGSPYLLLVAGTVPVLPGTKVGYALTADAPKSYMFRWTGDASVAGNGFQHFYGTIWTTGAFTSLTPGCTNMACPLESGDTVSAIATVAGGQAITWSTNASDGWDGFSFTTDTEPVIYDVYVDGSSRPDLFLFPGAPSGTPTSPTAAPFAISSTTGDDGGTEAGTSEGGPADSGGADANASDASTGADGAAEAGDAAGD